MKLSPPLAELLRARKGSASFREHNAAAAQTSTMTSSAPSSRLRFILATASSLLVFGAQSASALQTWSRPPGNGSGIWTDGANWDFGAPPNGPGNEEGRIDNDGLAIVDETQIDPFTGFLGQITTGSLTLGSQPGASGNLLMTGGTFTLKNTDMRIGGNPVVNIGNGVPTIGGAGQFTQTGGTVIQQGGNVNVGIRADSSAATAGIAEGTYNLSGENSSLTVMFGFILAIGNRATGTMNQTGGTVEVKNLAATNNGTLGSRIQLGRNALSGTTFTSGTYNLSGGSATAALFQFGHAAQTSGSSVNTLNLSGTGEIRTGTIEFLNTTTATNNFNFTGGKLSANTVGMPITNDGGTLSPYFADFATVTQFNSVVINPVGIMTFTGSNSYTQTSRGNLAIDLNVGSNDFVDIGAGAANVTANIAGRITVNLLNDIDPLVGTTYDILTADTIVNTAVVIGRTPSCNYFQASVEPGLDGRQVLRLTVIPPPLDYAGWQAIYQAGNFASDDDNDGILNGLEYAEGLVPRDSAAVNGRPPVVSLNGSGAAARLRIAFSTPQSSGTDVTLQVQASSDLGITDPWTPIASKVGQTPWSGPATVTVLPPQDCRTAVTVDDTVTIGAAPKRFLRLRAVVP